jgi:hypothetical protein
VEREMEASEPALRFMAALSLRLPFYETWCL